MPQEHKGVIIQGILGRWVAYESYFIYLDGSNCVRFPAQYSGTPLVEFKQLQFSPTNVNIEKLNLISSLISANSANYERLTSYLISLRNLAMLGNQYKAEAWIFEKFNEFIQSYRPIEIQVRDFLDQFKEENFEVIKKLGDLIQKDSNIFSDEDVLKKALNFKINKKLFTFPFLEQQNLFLGDIEDYKNIPQQWNYSGTHHKMWVSIKGLPFLINGYADDEYSAVNRVIVSQIGKILGLNVEEVFLAYLHGKCVNAIPYKPCVSILENEIFQMYELNHLEYLTQNEQKKAFNFLIQNWNSVIKVERTIKEKFSQSFVDEKGNVFISQLDKALFLTPQQMPKSLLIPFEINSFNYKMIKDMTDRVAKIDLVDVAFGSVPDNFVELHDIEAEILNKATFYQKKDSFDSNFSNLLKSLQQFEELGNRNGK